MSRISSPQRFLPFLIIALVAGATLGAGAWLVRSKKAQAAKAELAVAEMADVSGGGKPGAKPAHIRGERKAKVRLEEFADFQCPPCGNLATILHQLEQDYRGRLQTVFRHYPLKNHQFARPAALAAEAAAQQGRFWDMHDLLYKNRVTWSVAPDVRPLFNEYAQSLGLDMARFTADLAKPETDARITADQERATSLGVSQTPTLFVNNELLPAKSLSPEGVRAAIEKALAPPPAPTP